MRTEPLGQGLSFLHQPLHFISLSAFSPSQILLYHLCCSCSIFSLIPRVYSCLTYTVLNVIYPHLRDFRLLVHKFLENHCETKLSVPFSDSFFVNAHNYTKFTALSVFQFHSSNSFSHFGRYPQRTEGKWTQDSAHFDEQPAATGVLGGNSHRPVGVFASDDIA